MAPAAAASMPLLALALALALRLEPAQATTACVERGNISFCAALVTYQVADDLNQVRVTQKASALGLALTPSRAARRRRRT
jgi:hypothetical protein